MVYTRKGSVKMDLEVEQHGDISSIAPSVSNNRSNHVGQVYFQPSLRGAGGNS